MREPDPTQPQAVSPMGPLMETLGMVFVETSAERMVARMPVEGNTQPFGILHGGASAALAETVASVGGWLVDPSRMVMGLELKINHLRPVRDGWLTATGVPVHLGRTTQLWEIRIVSEDDRLVAFATCTLAVRSPTDE